MYDTVIEEMVPSLMLGRIIIPATDPLESFEEQVETWLDIEDVIANTVISDSVRTVCQEELRLAAQRGWKR